MEIVLTSSQVQRLRELGGTVDISISFGSLEDRERFFLREVTVHQKENRERLIRMGVAPERHLIAALENDLATALVAEGFLEVKTPTIISSSSLTKMGIGDDHPLHKQVFWLDANKCLRPMLAPNLYFLMRQLRRNLPLPIKFFEIGSCFRKESKGTNHLEEFTMLNLVEIGPEIDGTERLKQHIATVMDVVDLEYDLAICDSEVYGKTLDVMVDGSELASGAVGPIDMDKQFGVKDPWVGVGFGLERILMFKQKELNIKKVGRSLIYLNGARIDI